MPIGEIPDVPANLIGFGKQAVVPAQAIRHDVTGPDNKLRR